VKCQRTKWRRGVLIFADTRHKSVTIATSLERPSQLESAVMKPTCPSIFIESWAKIIPSTLVEITQTCVFLLVCVSTHFLRSHNNISRIYCNKVHEIFTRCRGFIGSSRVYNALPTYLRQDTNYRHFKQSVKEHMICLDCRRPRCIVACFRAP